MSELQEYKCPCCGGAINFDSSRQKLKCPYCDTEFEMDALSQYNDEVSKDTDKNMEWNTDSMDQWSEDAEGMKVYVCQSCGGEIVADDNTAASLCPFCDSPVVVKGSIAGELKPDVIIPFKLDKKAAKEKFSAHLNGKKLLPKVFKDQNHIEEIKGMYVPYWIFDSKADAHMRYKATRLHHWSDSNYDYTETSYYAVLRDGNIAFSHVPADGSSKMPDDMMESLEPYDFSDAVPFNSGFFAGFYADKYDVDEKESAIRVNERVKNATEDSFMSTVMGYSSVIPDGGSINLTGGKVSYAMYPVWILTTLWNGDRYTFAMNGQTGKFVGNLPVDKSLFGKYFAIGSVITGIVAFLISSLVWMLM